VQTSVVFSFALESKVWDACFPQGEVFCPHSGHLQDALLRPLNDRFMNQQGNINGEVYVPKCVGNATSKTNQKILV
jgi:hypothetical protein